MNHDPDISSKIKATLYMKTKVKMYRELFTFTLYFAITETRKFKLYNSSNELEDIQ